MMVLIISLLLLSPVLWAGIYMAKAVAQAEHDGRLKTYKLSFPRDLDEERSMAWLRSISGTLRPTSFHVGGSPTIVFETWATSRGITHRLKVPWQHADYIIAQLRSLVPGIRVTPEPKPPKQVWTKAVEVGLSGSHRPLRIYSASDLATSLLASVQALSEKEAVLMQWVVTPAVPQRAPIYRQSKSAELRLEHLTRGNLADRDEIKDRRAKLEEPNIQGVLRVGALAETPIRADHLIYKVRAALASARGPSSRFVKRFVTKKTLQQRIDKASGCVIFPIRLSVPELAALVAWPINNPNIIGLPAPHSRHLPANESVPRTGRVLGRSNMPGNERPIAIAYEHTTKHVHVMGPTGVGKTTLLSNMFRQDVLKGHGVILIEAKGDLFNTALDYIPKDRLDDVHILDINDVKFPVGFNIIRQGDPRVVIDELSDLFDYMYKDARGVWTREVLYHALRTLTVHPELTFVDLAPLLVPMSTAEAQWRDTVVRAAQDVELRNFWQRFENQPRARQDQITQPVMDRIWQLNARPEVRNIIGQSQSSFLMDDIIRHNKILLVNLSGIASETASLLGTLLMNALWHSVKTVKPEKTNHLYLDELQSFLGLPIDPKDMLVKSRSFGLGMVLSHQDLGQLPSDLKQAVLSNARTKVIFQTSADDAKAMSREFGSAVDEEDFLNLGSYEALTRIATGNSVSPPCSLVTNEPAKRYGHAGELRYLSRKNHGRALAEVEQQILQRRSPTLPEGKKKLPRISGI